jgi:hypothetical protein
LVVLKDEEQGRETERHLLWFALNVPPREEADIDDESCRIQAINQEQGGETERCLLWSGLNAPPRE